MAIVYKPANWPLGLIGAVGGGVLGYFAFPFMAGQGFYAIYLPGALLGLGCSWLSGGKSNALGVLCALLALALEIFLVWQFTPFVADTSLRFFLAHLQDLTTTTLTMIGLGTFFGFWFGKGREGKAINRRDTDS